MVNTKTLVAMAVIMTVTSLGLQAQTSGFTIAANGNVDVNGQLKLVANPTAASDAATKTYVDTLAPTAIVASSRPAAGVNGPGASYYIRNDGWAEVVGWEYLTGISGTSQTTPKTLTLPITFLSTNYMDVFISVIGFKTVSAPTSRTDVNGMTGGEFGETTIVSPSSLQVRASTAGTFTSSATYILVSYRVAGWTK